MLKALLTTAVALLSSQSWAGIEQPLEAYEHGEFSGALDGFRELASQDDVRTNYLGLMAARGEGRKRDSESASYWMTKSAEAGDPAAQITLASWYCGAGVVESNVRQCLHWFHASIQAGNSAGAIQLGQQILSRVTSKAEAGDASSQWGLSILYRSGAPGIAANKTQSERWLQRSLIPRADEDNEGLQISCYRRWVQEGAGDPAPCVDLVLADAEAGDVNAMVVLTWLYGWDGIGAYPQPAEAFRWAKRAAATGAPLGLIALGLAYQHGTGIPVDDAEAFHWFFKAAEMGDLNGQAMVGYLYQEGKGVTQDYGKSCRWAERSALKRQAFALQLLIEQYKAGLGKPIDLPRAYALAVWVPVTKIVKDNEVRDSAIVEVKATMTSQQLEIGDKLVTQWNAEGYSPGCPTQ